LTGAVEGMWHMVVTNPDGSEGVLADAFIVYLRPEIYSNAYGYGSVAETVTIFGTNFGSDPGAGNKDTTTNNVSFNGTVVLEANISYWSNEEIKCTVPSGATDGQLMVRRKGVVSTNSISFDVLTEAPGIISLYINKGLYDTSVTVTNILGSNISPSATVILSNSTTADTIAGTNVVHKGSNSITNVVFDLNNALKDNWDVIVKNPDGSIGTKTGGFNVFTIPVINSIVPDYGSRGELVTITGTNFSNVDPGFRDWAPNTYIRIGGAAAVDDGLFTYWSNIQIILKPDTDSYPGKILIKNLDGTNTDNNFFNLITNTPTVSSIAPAIGIKGITNIITNITGTNFSPSATLKLSNSNAVYACSSMAIKDITSFTNAVLFITNMPAGVYDVWIDNPDTGKGGGRFTNAFTIIDSDPVLTNIYPNFGSANEIVTNYGYQFGADPGAGFRSTITNNVKIADVQLSNSNIISWSDTQIVLRVPFGATNGPVTVKTKYGTTAEFPFTVITNAPVVTGMIETNVLNGQSVTFSNNILGQYFSPSMTIALSNTTTADSISGTDVQILYSTNIYRVTFDLTSAAIGDWGVLVKNPDGQWSFTNNILYIEGETTSITNIDPNIVYNDIETEISVLGMGFREGLRLYIDTVIPTNITVSNVASNEITATVPKNLTAGEYTLTIVNTDASTYTSEIKITIAERPLDGNVDIIDNVLDPHKDEYAIFSFNLKKESQVTIIVYTILGEKVYEKEYTMSKGSDNKPWYGRNNAGRIVARGLYYVQVKVNGEEKIFEVFVVR
ncbi:IPT/TIG domain-containing protein, partial [Spirochaetota bacterium]